ncbi:MAG: VanZ family protein [Bacteroidales bacterium]
MKIRYLLPAILWSFVILLIIGLPGSNIPKTNLFTLPHFDKLVHAFMFAGFGLFLAYGFIKQDKEEKIHRHAYIASITFCVLYGGATELIQHYWVSGRSGEWADMLANTLGAMAGVALLDAIRRNARLSAFFSL